MSEDSEVSEVEVGFPGGFSAKVKSRVISALDHLGANKLLKRGLKDEHLLAIERAKHQQEVKAIEALGDVAVERIKSDPDLLDALMDAHFPSLARKKDNVAAAIDHASEQLLRLPPPSDVNVETAPENMDTDWLNFWEDVAEKASTDRMRQMWGRILAGEAHTEGSFSFSTLRVVSELSSAIAEEFQRNCSGGLKTAFWSSGDGRSHLFLLLEDAGLVQGASNHFMLSKTFETNDPGRKTFYLGPYRLLVHLKDGSASAASTGVVPLTRAGQQLAAILPYDEAEALRKLAIALDEKITSAVLYRVEEGNELVQEQVLKAPPDEAQR